VPVCLEPWNGEGVHLLHAEAGRQALDLLEGIATLHRREHAARREQMRCQGYELRNFGKRARNDEIEFFSGVPCLQALAHHGCVLQLKIRYRLPEEGRFLLIAVEQSHLNVGPGYRNGNARESRAAACVQHPSSSQIGDYGEAVKQVAAHHFSLVSYRGEVIDLVPFLQERSEEHTSELQSRLHLVCRLLLENKTQIGYRA